MILSDLETGPELVSVTVDPPRAGEVHVRMAASGICGSDLHLVHGRSNVTFLPAVLGHEGAGVVEEVGPGVTTLQPGDHVVVAMSAPCGSCGPCSRLQPHLCESADRGLQVRGLMPDGTSRVHRDGSPLHPFVGCGTLAEHLVVPEGQLIQVPDDVPLELAALTACGVITGLGAVFNIAEVRPGHTVLVVGCGGVGLSVVQGCRISGAARIVAVDANPARLAVAGRAGATDLVDASNEDMSEAVARLVPGGVDVAFEVVGSAALVGELFDLVRPGGTCVATASYPPGSELSIKPQSLFWDRRLRGCVAGNSIPRRDIPKIMRLYQRGALDLELLAGERWTLDSVLDAFAAAEQGRVPRAVVTM
ncbi:MAG: alcohol dehydrogenase [Acidimicrobiales bacterium]|nr:alcohol dehydrogenase [Acidimicrobiales bacterium]